MRDLSRRIEKLEQQAGTGGEGGCVTVYYTTGPQGADAAALLAAEGRHLVEPYSVVHFVRGEDGRPADAPLADLTDAIRAAAMEA